MTVAARIHPVASAGLCVLSGALVVRAPRDAAGALVAAVALAAARRWPALLWVAALALGLFAYHVAWSVRVGPSLHLSEAVVIGMAGAAVAGGVSRPHLSRAGTVALVGAAAFFALVVAAAYRTARAEGLQGALQARHLSPYLLVCVLPFAVEFRAVEARTIVDLVAKFAVALGLRSAYLVATGHVARDVPGVQRIYQTWEPFLAGALGLLLLAWLLAGRRATALHYAGLVGCGIPFVFGFFRTAWVIGLALAALLALRVARTRRLPRLLGVPAVVACLAATSLIFGGTPRWEHEVSTRVHAISPRLDSYRTQEYTAVWREIRRHPLAGSGFGTEYAGDWTIYRSWAHNAYEWVWWRLGAVGLLAFAALVGGALAAGYAGRRLGGDDRTLALGLTAALAFTALAANLHENFENYQTNMVMALVVAQLLVLGARAREAA